MKLYKFKLYTLIMLLLTATVMFQSCDKDDEPQPSNTITKIISEDARFSLFKAAIIKAELTNFTDGPGPFTFLIPTNDAFKAIGINTEADITAFDKSTLITILTYHLISTDRKTIDMPKGPNAPITTQGGGTLYVAKYDNGIFVNGTKLIEADIAASNGTIHVINRVLIPPTINAFSLLSANPNFSLMVQAINRAAVSSNFTATGPITVFAPTNTAFEAAGLNSATIATTSATTLASILKYHIYTGRVYSSELKSGTLKTVQGTNIILDLSNGAKIKGTNNSTSFDITGFDISATNGVLHTINGVLNP